MLPGAIIFGRVSDTCRLPLVRVGGCDTCTHTWNEIGHPKPNMGRSNK